MCTLCNKVFAQSGAYKHIKSNACLNLKQLHCRQCGEKMSATLLFQVQKAASRRVVMHKELCPTCAGNQHLQVLQVQRDKEVLLELSRIGEETKRAPVHFPDVTEPIFLVESTIGRELSEIQELQHDPYFVSWIHQVVQIRVLDLSATLPVSKKVQDRANGGAYPPPPFSVAETALLQSPNDGSVGVLLLPGKKDNPTFKTLSLWRIPIWITAPLLMYLPKKLKPFNMARYLKDPVLQVVPLS